jgi:hypothetical protein
MRAMTVGSEFNFNGQNMKRWISTSYRSDTRYQYKDGSIGRIGLKKAKHVCLQTKF